MLLFSDNLTTFEQNESNVKDHHHHHHHHQDHYCENRKKTKKKSRRHFINFQFIENYHHWEYYHFGFYSGFQEFFFCFHFETSFFPLFFGHVFTLVTNLKCKKKFKKITVFTCQPNDEKKNWKKNFWPWGDIFIKIPSRKIKWKWKIWFH